MPALESYLRKQVDAAQLWLDNDSWWPSHEKYVLITADASQAQGYGDEIGFKLIGTSASMTGVICRSEYDAILRCKQWNDTGNGVELHVSHYRDALRRARLSWQVMLSEVQKHRESIDRAVNSTYHKSIG